MASKKVTTKGIEVQQQLSPGNWAIQGLMYLKNKLSGGD